MAADTIGSSDDVPYCCCCCSCCSCNFCPLPPPPPPLPCCACAAASRRLRSSPSISSNLLSGESPFFNAENGCLSLSLSCHARGAIAEGHLNWNWRDCFGACCRGSPRLYARKWPHLRSPRGRLARAARSRRRRRRTRSPPLTTHLLVLERQQQRQRRRLHSSAAVLCAVCQSPLQRGQRAAWLRGPWRKN